MLFPRLFRLAVTAACATMLAACGSGDDGADGADGRSTLMALTAEPAGANCVAGGTRVAAGLDLDADGTLQPAEVTQVAYVCDGPAGANGANGTDGTNGTDGQTALIALAVEPVGANCAAGGTRVDAGPDANANNTLDAGEIAATSYVCNGLAPAWVNLSATVQQAESNRSYLANARSVVTLTLPAS